jgi:predicted flap endonuclease-1-like 5' DNA nuclease
METPETFPGISAGTSVPRQTLAMRMAERSRLRAERAERLARLAPARGGQPPEAAGPAAHPAAPDAPAPVRFVSSECDPECDLGRDPECDPECDPGCDPECDSGHDAAAALEEFLRSLTRGLDGRQPSAPPPFQQSSQPPFQPRAGEVLPFQRSAPPAAPIAVPPDARGAATDPEPTCDPHCDLRRLAGVGPGLAWALRRAGIPDLASVAALEPEALAARLGPLGRLVPARAWIEAARAAPDRR